MGNKGEDWSISWTLAITLRVGGPIIEQQNCAYPPPKYHVVFDDALYTVEHTRRVTIPGNWENLI